MTVFLFHVVEEKTQKVLVLFQASSKKPSKRKKLWNSFDKNRADVLAASDRGSHVEQAAGEVDCSRRGRTKSMGERDR